jgi:hypothetical protein
MDTHEPLQMCRRDFQTSPIDQGVYKRFLNVCRRSPSIMYNGGRSTRALSMLIENDEDVKLERLFKRQCLSIHVSPA